MHLYLTGYRGSGKSTLGRRLASELKRPFVDSDDWIEEKSGQSIREIFAAQGESGFRDLEETAIEAISQLPTPTVVALGGGAILREANRNRLAATGRCLLLEASPERLYERINADATSGERRPKLSDRSGFDEVVAVLEQRRPLYHQVAQKILSTDGKTPDELVLEILDWANSSA